MKMGDGWFALGLTVLSAIAAALVLYSTVWGAGLISDSFQYIATAKTLVRQGYWGYPAEDGSLIPLAQYPPLFPAVLALLEAVGFDALSGVRFLNAGLVAANGILVGLTAGRIFPKKAWGLLAALLVLGNREFVEAHAWALSEPLYLFLALSGILFLAGWLSKRRPALLLAAGFCIALASLTRFIGLALILCGVMAIVFYPSQSWKKWFGAAAFGLLTVLPLAIWTIRTARLTSTINNRLFDYVPLSGKNLLSLAQTVLGWFIPSQWIVGSEKVWLTVLALGGLAGAAIVIYLWRRGKLDEQSLSSLLHPLALLWGFYAVLHLLFLILAKVGFDHNIGFGERLLLPAWLGVMFVLTAVLAWLWQTNSRLFRLPALILVCALLLYYLVGSVISIPRWHKQGLGLARKSWHESQAIQTLRRLDTAVIYSNSPSTVYLWAGSPGRSLNEFAQLVESGAHQEVYLVVFHHIQANPRLQRLSAGLPIVMDDRIATIYQYPP